MSDKHYIGLGVTSFENTGKHKPVSRVTLFLDGENYYTAGDDTGKEITANCPSATQAMADALLAKFKGYEHQSFNADAANIDPAAELGDGVTVGGIYATLSRLKDDGNGYAGVSAADEPELEEEYPYISPIQQEIKRQSAEVYSVISKTAEEIQLEVQGLEDKYTSVSVTLDGLTVTDEDGTTRIKGSSVETDTLIVNAANINGTLKANQIDATDLHVNAANIDGTLTVDQIEITGAITWNDLSSGVQSTINGAYNSGGVTENQVTVITQNAIATASISANQITTGTLYAQNAYGQTAISVSGLLGLMYGGSYYGYVGASTAGSFAGAVLTDSTMNNYFIATTGGARMSASNQSEIYVIASGCYSTSAMQVASDKRLKNSIKYDMEKYEDLFMQLKPCSYYLNKGETDKRHWGFIAQDFAESIAAAGFVENELAALGYDGEHYSIGYTEVVPLNTHMIQKIIKALAATGVTV